MKTIARLTRTNDLAINITAVAGLLIITLLIAAFTYFGITEGIKEFF